MGGGDISLIISSLLSMEEKEGEEQEEKCSFRIIELAASRKITASDIVTHVLVADIESKDTSYILKQLATLLPLQRFSMGHLKRVKKDRVSKSLEVLLGPELDVLSLPTSLTDLFKSKKMQQVCKLQPQSRVEYDEWSQWWPTFFRPNTVDRERERGISLVELKRISEYMKLVEADAIEVAKLRDTTSASSFIGGGIIVNPLNEKVKIRRF